MALPTAQLGQMSSINMPSHMPTVLVPRQPRLWEQALAQILTQAAGQAVGQGIKNTMSGEYASEFGKTPNTGLKKFLYGSAIPQEEASRLRAADERSALEQYILDSRQAQERTAQDAALERQMAGDTSAEMRALDAAASARNLENLRSQNNLTETRERISGEGDVRERLARIEKQLMSPLEESQAGYYRARTEAERADAAAKGTGTDLLRQRLEESKGKGGKTPLPGLPGASTSTEPKAQTRTAAQWVKYYMDAGLRGSELEDAVRSTLRSQEPATSTRSTDPMQYYENLAELILNRDTPRRGFAGAGLF